MALYTPNERCVNGSALPLPLAGEGGAMERPANAVSSGYRLLGWVRLVWKHV